MLFIPLYLPLVLVSTALLLKHQLLLIKAQEMKFEIDALYFLFGWRFLDAKNVTF